MESAESLSHVGATGDIISVMAQRVDAMRMLAEYLDLLRSNDLSDSTVEAYFYGVWRLLKFHKFRIHPDDITHAEIGAFLASLGHHGASKYQYAKGIRSAFEFWLAVGYVSTDPTRLVKVTKPKRRPAEDFDERELARLLTAARAHHPQRAWAILACATLGTRRMELVNIAVADIDFDRKVVHLRVTKGDRPRDVPMGPWAEEAVRALMQWSDGRLLLPICTGTFSGWVHSAAVEAGFPPGRKQRGHTLRASFVTWLLNDHVPPHVVSALVGHADLASTMIYAAVRGTDGAQAVQTFSDFQHAV